MTKSNKPPLGRLLRFFWRGYKKWILIGSSAILIIDTAELIFPILLKDAVDSFAQGAPIMHFRDHLIKGLLVVIVLQVFGRYLWRVALSRSAMLAGASLRQDFSEKSFRLLIPKFETRKVGDLMTLATSDIENMRMALGPGLISAIDACFYCIALPIAMFILSPHLAWKVLIPVSAIPFVVLFLQKKIESQSGLVQKQIGRLGTMAQEMISGIRIIKTYGLEEKISQKLDHENHALNLNQVELMQNQVRMGPAMEFFLSTSVILLFATPGISVGTLVAMQRYLQKLLWPLSATANAVIFFQKAKNSGQEYYGLIDDSDVEEFPSVTPAPLKSGVAFIEAKNLNFSYLSGKPVLKNLSFQIHEGEWVGISGPVGSGKSTLLQLLLKFYAVDRGQLFINGKDINDWKTEEVRFFFTVVMQDPYLFQGTLQENLDIAPDQHSLSEVMSASGMGSQEFSHRMNVRLGERGAGLSGGQKQRVGIARALRKKSPILLMDDPLSSVDLKTAENILREFSLQIKTQKRTVIFVTHHEEHLRFCDRTVGL